MTEKSKATDVARYYTFIYLWTQLTNRFRAFDKVAAHTIHRPLIDPETGEFSTGTIHRMIAAAAAGLGEINALDAGCGYGGTAMDLCKLMGGRWHGITISPEQVRIATRNAKAMGIAEAVTFSRGTFDDPPPGRFNLIYGIESLIHSVDPAKTIGNLSRALVPGGLLLIIDDMPIADVPAGYTVDLAGFKRMWRAPVMPTALGWSEHLEAAGCAVEPWRDLTDLMRPRSEAEIVDGLKEIEESRRWRDRIGLRLVGDAQEGGLRLERLTGARVVRHMLIAGRKR